MLSISFVSKLVCGFGLLLSIGESNSNDLCSIGRTGYNTIANGNFTYEGLDSGNSNYPKWKHICKDAVIEWGGKYGYSFYVVAPENTTGGIYAYCSLSNTNPYDCDDSWYFWSGSAWEVDSSFTVEYCSYYTGQSDCSDYSYLTNIGIDATSAYCIVNPTIRSDINGSYEYVGCDEGLPYFVHTEHSIYYLHYDWCYSYWFIGPDITGTSFWAYCNDYDFSNCDNGLYEYDGSTGTYLDTSVTINLCTPRPTSAPTTEPTDKPTEAPTDPTGSPSPMPTSNPTAELLSEPVCAIGRTGYNTIVNGNFTYEGLDSGNSDYPKWKHICKDAVIEWGGKYGLSFYVVAPENTTGGVYGYCSLSNTYPYECDGNWYVWSGSSWGLDSSYSVEYCSDYTSQSDCSDYTYLTSLSIDAVEGESGYCVINPTIRSDINGSYEYVGCDEGMPYYVHTERNTYYLHYDWCYNYWFIGPDISATNFWAYCNDYDFSNCNNGLYEYDGSTGTYLDTSVGIDVCTPPTSSPTPQPSDATEYPTVSPSMPSNAPTKIPSMVPTDSVSTITTTMDNSMASTLSSTQESGENGDDDDDTDDDSDNNGSGSEATTSSSGVFDSSNTVYMVAGLGALLLCCWLCFCVWYARRRQREKASEGDVPGNVNDENKVGTLTNVASISTDVADGGSGAGTGATGSNMMQYSTNGNQVNPNAVVLAQQRQLEMQKMQLQHMQHAIQMQQLQSHQMMQHHMQMMQNGLPMQPSVNFNQMGAMGQMTAMGPNTMMMTNSSDNNNGGGEGMDMSGNKSSTNYQELAGQSPMSAQSNMSFDFSQGNNVNNNNNGIGGVGIPLMPTNPVANAFTNGVAEAYVNGEGGNGGDDDEEESSHMMFGDEKTTGGAAAPLPPPPQFDD